MAQSHITDYYPVNKIVSNWYEVYDAKMFNPSFFKKPKRFSHPYLLNIDMVITWYAVLYLRSENNVDGN